MRFARKQLLCPDGERSPRAGGDRAGCRGCPLTAPLPVSHRHFGLLGLALALGLVVTVLLLNCRSTWRMPSGEGRRFGQGMGHPKGWDAPGTGRVQGRCDAAVPRGLLRAGLSLPSPLSCRCGGAWPPGAAAVLS